MRSIFNFQAGQSLVELLVAIGFAAILIPALLTGMIAARGGRTQDNQRTQALGFAKETQEAVRSIRNNSWATFTSYPTGTSLHPVLSGTTWTLATGAALINGFAFTRQVVINNIYRDVNGNIALSGTLDPSFKQVIVTVSWSSPIPSSVTSTAYLARFTNNAYTQTTVTDFNSGSNSATTVVATTGTGIINDGQVQLGAGGGSDWCSPTLSISSVDLPGQGITTAITAVPGHAYTTTGGNSSGDSMDSVNITDPPAPSAPVGTVGGSYNYRKTYAIFTDGSYTYLTSDHPGLTVDIVEVTSQPYTESGTFNAGGTGTSVYVANNIGYVTVGSTLYTFDLSSKTGSRAQLGSVNLSGTGTKVVVNGNYAYVSISGGAYQMQIIQVTNSGKTLSVVGQAAVNGSNGQDIFVNSSATRAYIATSYVAGKNELFILDISTKTGNRPTVGSYGTNGMDPKGLVVVPGNRAIIVGNGGQQYQVVDITNEGSPISCGGLTNPNGATSVNAVASVVESDGDVFSYILTNNASKEFQIIEGGPGGQFSTSGIFESSTFNATNDAMFNSFVVHGIIPSQTALQYRVAVKHGSNGSCSTVTFADSDFIGNDGTSATYFATSSALPIQTSGNGYINPGQCLRFRAYFSTTDITESPVFYDITFNYSP